MKVRILGLILMGTIITLYASGQNLKALQVPLVIKSSFIKSQPGVKAKWSMEDGKYETGFKKNGQDISLYEVPVNSKDLIFDAIGSFIEEIK